MMITQMNLALIKRYRIATLIRRLALCTFASANLWCSFAQAQIFRDPNMPIEERVTDLVSRMTLDEKVRQMQNDAPAIPRLGVPAYEYWSEALHGVARGGEATMFPQAIGMAATWDTPLLHAEGETIGIEARARYNQAQRAMGTRPGDAGGRSLPHRRSRGSVHPRHTGDRPQILSGNRDAETLRSS